jgi:hypothetical protein
MKMRKLCAWTSCEVEPLESRRLLSTYYVSPAGSDSASGLAMTAPWKSISRVNAQVLRPGDKVLFQGGKTFGGGLKVETSEGGTSTNRITFSTYGTGRATISSGSANGLWVPNAAGVNVSNLRFVGSGMYNNKSWGVFFHVDQTGKSVSGISINNVEVTGYGREGIRFVASGTDASINDVSVTNTDSHDNLWGGVKANTYRISGMKNYVIDHVRVWNNYGDKLEDGVTGNGIMLEGVAGARISYCVAHDNGKDGKAPVGIWGAMGERITIEHCESYNNNTATLTDGGGFDFDWDVKNSVMQYNYSHNNSGPGYILAAGAHYNQGNVIRYNISENDGRENGRAGIQMWGNIVDAQIYNNVIYITPTNNSNTAALYTHDSSTGGKRPRNVKIYNNVFYTTGGVKILNVTASVAKYADMQFSGNCYYSAGSAFKIQWGTEVYSSLAAWQDATGKEMLPATTSTVAAMPMAAMLLTTTSTTGSISGTVFSDANGNGAFDTGDTALSNRKIYIDANANNKCDIGEIAAYSNASGVYTLANLKPGTYRIRRADMPAGYYVTTPATQLDAVAVTAGRALTGVNVGATTGTAPTGGTTTTRRTGYQGDPKFLAVGNGGTFGNADLLKNLTAYKLQAGSPLINKGVIQPGTLLAASFDFWGDALPKGGKYDIGIDEVA